jgi:DNA transformation protein and related proteins
VAVSSDFLAYVLDQLAGLGGVESKRMFGGVGLYCDEFFFGLISKDVLYLRVDESNREDFASRGVAQFRPYEDKPHLSMNYYEAPADVLEDARQLAEWARRSMEVAQRAPPKEPRARRKTARPAGRPSRQRARLRS